jgi:hypothetical protein
MSKESTAAATTQQPIVRDEQGFGVLQGFENFHVPQEGFADGAVVNGKEVLIVRMYDDEAAAALEDSMVASWEPIKPEGDGWVLALVADSDEGPFALWARPAPVKQLEGVAYAQEFLLGSLIKAATKHLKTLAKPWGELKEHEQARVLGQVHDDCRKSVRDAIDIIAGNARLTFTAAVDQVVFKDGVKAVLTLAKTAEAHSLADAEGSYVTIVIEERSKLLNEGDALQADKDQKPLFDSSTEGTQAETEKSVMQAA